MANGSAGSQPDAPNTGGNIATQSEVTRVGSVPIRQKGCRAGRRDCTVHRVCKSATSADIDIIVAAFAGANWRLNAGGVIDGRVDLVARADGDCGIGGQGGGVGERTAGIDCNTASCINRRANVDGAVVKRIEDVDGSACIQRASARGRHRTTRRRKRDTAAASYYGTLNDGIVIIVQIAGFQNNALVLGLCLDRTCAGQG